MATVSELTSKNIASAQANVQTWGNIIVNVKVYGAKGDGVADDTAAIQSAVDAASLVEGIVWIQKGKVFIVDMLTVPSNITITGGGTLKFKNETTMFALLKLDLVDNVIIENIIFDGNVTNQTTWSESRHCVILYGSTNVDIIQCTFTNIIGDGIYVSHNGDLVQSENVNIYNNRFTGNNTNRNGISIIHCKDSSIRHNYFKGMARDDMPGDIDIEPNAATESVTGVIIESNRMIGKVGTPVLQKAISVNNNSAGICTDISIVNNKITGNYKYAISSFGDTVNNAKTQATIKGNTIQSTMTLAGSSSIILSSTGIYDISENNIDSTVDFGINMIGAQCKISSNKIKNCAKYGIEEIGGSSDSGSIKGNTIEDCGTNEAASYGGIHIKGSYIDILDNTVVSSATTKTQTGIYIETGVKNFILGNTFKGLGVRALNFTTAPQVIGNNVYNGSFNSIGGTYPPTTESWVEGDTIYLPTAEGYIYKCIARGTPGTWVTSQLGWLTSISATPIFVGQMALVAGVWYKAIATTAPTDWKALN